MGYLVTRRGGMTNEEFVTYIHKVYQSQKRFNNLPRIPDATGRRWQHVWASKDEALAVVEEMHEWTDRNGWRVSTTDATPSVGPLGPLLIMMYRQWESLNFQLNELSVALLGEVVPAAVRSMSCATLTQSLWTEHWAGRARDLAEQFTPQLTGLTAQQLNDLGFLVIDSDTDETWLEIPPAGIATFKMDRRNGRGASRTVAASTKRSAHR